MKLESLLDLYIEQLRDIYDAEKQLIDALPKMVEAATAPELKHALEDHLNLTEGQIDRLNDIFEKRGARPAGRKCAGMTGLIEECEEATNADVDDELKDSSLIAGAQRIEHYEIAAYGSARAYAETLGHDEEADLLQQSLDEECDADDRLGELAEELINLEAFDEREEA